MNSIEQNAQTLSSFGLTIKQAKVYLALVFLGTAPVGEISKLSKVRREEVYRILPKLEKMGLIEKTLSVPVKLKATTVANALSILIREEEEKTRNRLLELNAKKAEFLDHFRTSSKEAKLGNEDQFSIVSEKSLALGKIETLIESAQTEINLCTSREKLFQFLKFFSEPLCKAGERGVKFRIISRQSTGEDDISKAINQTFSPNVSVAVRYLDNLPNHFLIMDSTGVLVATAITGYLADNPLLWSSNIPHIMVYRRLFDDLWDSSVESVTLDLLNEVEKLRNFIRNLQPASHNLLIHETKQAKLNILLNYIKYALECNEAAVYVCSEVSVEDIKEAMNAFGINIKKYEKNGALRILDYTQHFIIDGRFDIANTLRLWQGYYDEAISKGFKGLKATAETFCFFKHNLIKELIDYEKTLHTQNSNPMIAIYDFKADQLMNSSNPINVYSEFLKYHSAVLFSWIDKDLGRIAIS